MVLIGNGDLKFGRFEMVMTNLVLGGSWTKLWPITSQLALEIHEQRKTVELVTNFIELKNRETAPIWSISLQLSAGPNTTQVHSSLDHL